MKPSKVTIEITPKLYTMTVLTEGGEVLSKRSMIKKSWGSKADKPGEFADDLPKFEELAEAMENENPSDIMKALGKL